jgi:hypothetical protein
MRQKAPVLAVAGDEHDCGAALTAALQIHAPSTADLDEASEISARRDRRSGHRGGVLGLTGVGTLSGRISTRPRINDGKRSIGAYLLGPCLAQRNEFKW